MNIPAQEFAPVASKQPERSTREKPKVAFADKIGWSVDETIQTVPWGRTTTYKMIASGIIKSKKVAGRRVIDPASVRALLGDEAAA